MKALPNPLSLAEASEFSFTAVSFGGEGQGIYDTVSPQGILGKEDGGRFSLRSHPAELQAPPPRRRRLHAATLAPVACSASAPLTPRVRQGLVSHDIRTPKSLLLVADHG